MTKHPPRLHLLPTNDRPKCHGKNRYASQHEAMLVREQQELLHSDLELSVYKCFECKLWHLTRQK